MTPLKPCRVLVVEDEYFLADDLAKALHLLGAEVVGPIGDLDEAVDQVKRDGFDVAVLDINLRNKATYGIADLLSEAAIPFIFVTGYSAEVLPLRFRHVTRMEKPCDVERMLSAVTKLCNKIAA